MLMFLEEDGQLFSWGWNKYGQVTFKYLNINYVKCVNVVLTFIFLLDFSLVLEILLTETYLL